jgi:4a-hydroxytetrahydrobiopterin dehydratase
MTADCCILSSMPTPLSEHDVRNALLRLPGWHLNGQAIERVFRFADFKQAMEFVNRIADAAEEANHHPDIAISYNKVTLALISHDSGGVTERDVKMAARINEIAG